MEYGYLWLLDINGLRDAEGNERSWEALKMVIRVSQLFYFPWWTFVADI